MSYKRCLEYIENYWEKIIFFTPKDKKTIIGLPHHYLVPNETFFDGDEFYWDSFFMSLGFLSYEKIENTHIVSGIIDNFGYLQRKYGIIPLRNRLFNLGISQPPFLTTLILEVYKRTKDKLRLEEWASIAKTELNEYWKGETHKTKNNLSRYCDKDILDITAEIESGWDMTSRFNNKCLSYLPIDLNSNLYKYEKDLSEIYSILGDEKKAKKYFDESEKRKKIINELMWNQETGFYFDYNYNEQKQSEFYSLAGFFPLWAGVASQEQAKNIVKKTLELFEKEGGLVNTQEILTKDEAFKQWDYPNGWAPTTWIAIEGLKKYGFYDEAKRIAKKWLDLNKKIFEETGEFYEKYDVVNLKIGKEGRYPLQKGFGWTNGVFVKLHNDFFSEEELKKDKK